MDANFTILVKMMDSVITKMVILLANTPNFEDQFTKFSITNLRPIPEASLGFRDYKIEMIKILERTF